MLQAARASDARPGIAALSTPRRRAEASWLTGTPWLLSSDPETDRPSDTYVVALKLVRQHEADGASEATAMLAVGLPWRVGHVLSGPTLRFYGELGKRGAELPRGLAVCDRCRVVFRPRRKGAARRCESCHAGGAPADAPAHLLLRCVQCGHSFQASRRDARHCSTRCRVRVHRAR